jgi:arabinoxylan arabinofuranohydrolase
LLRLVPEGIDGTITILYDRPWTSQGGKVLGEIKLKSSMEQTSTELSAKLRSLGKLKGKHALFFVFKSDTENKNYGKQPCAQDLR